MTFKGKSRESTAQPKISQLAKNCCWKISRPLSAWPVNESVKNNGHTSKKFKNSIFALIHSLWTETGVPFLARSEVNVRINYPFTEFQCKNYVRKRVLLFVLVTVFTTVFNFLSYCNFKNRVQRFIWLKLQVKLPNIQFVVVNFFKWLKIH